MAVASTAAARTGLVAGAQVDRCQLAREVARSALVDQLVGTHVHHPAGGLVASIPRPRARPPARTLDVLRCARLVSDGPPEEGEAAWWAARVAPRVRPLPGSTRGGAMVGNARGPAGSLGVAGRTPAKPSRLFVCAECRYAQLFAVQPRAVTGRERLWRAPSCSRASRHALNSRRARALSRSCRGVRQNSNRRGGGPRRPSTVNGRVTLWLPVRRGVELLALGRHSWRASGSSIGVDKRNVACRRTPARSTGRVGSDVRSVPSAAGALGARRAPRAP